MSKIDESSQNNIVDKKVERNVYALGWVAFFGGLSQA